jgi:hypothetical protein
VELLRDGSDEGRAKAAWALMNLASRNDANKVAVVAAGAIPPLVEVLRDGRAADGSRNAARVLYNLTFRDAGQRYTRDQLRALFG